MNIEIILKRLFKSDEIESAFLDGVFLGHPVHSAPQNIVPFMHSRARQAVQVNRRDQPDRL